MFPFTFPTPKFHLIPAQAEPSSCIPLHSHKYYPPPSCWIDLVQPVGSGNKFLRLMVIINVQGRGEVAFYLQLLFHLLSPTLPQLFWLPAAIAFNSTQHNTGIHILVIALLWYEMLFISVNLILNILPSKTILLKISQRFLKAYLLSS